MKIEAVLTGWEAKRAGGRITVTHSAGKIANIDVIKLLSGKIIAVGSDHRLYELSMSAN